MDEIHAETIFLETLLPNKMCLSHKSLHGGHFNNCNTKYVEVVKCQNHYFNSFDGEQIDIDFQSIFMLKDHKNIWFFYPQPSGLVVKAPFLREERKET